MRAIKPAKNPASKVIFSSAKSAAKPQAEDTAAQPGQEEFKNHAIRAHEAIKKVGKSISEAHDALKVKLFGLPQKLPGAKKEVLLLNMTKNHMISNKVVFADTTFQKFRGLMFKNRKEVNYALVFDFKKALKDSAAIHMFFVFFPIDVVYLRDSKVVDLHRAVQPFTAYLAPKKHADTLIELPQGTIWKSGISIGDEIVTTK